MHYSGPLEPSDLAGHLGALLPLLTDAHARVAHATLELLSRLEPSALFPAADAALLFGACQALLPAHS